METGLNCVFKKKKKNRCENDKIHDATKGIVRKIRRDVVCHVRCVHVSAGSVCRA